jgi:methanogenic corrinoid protein MtbC1
MSGSMPGHVGHQVGHSQVQARRPPGRKAGAPLEPAAASLRARDRLRVLAETIEAEIVPRLIAGYESGHGHAAVQPSGPAHDPAIDILFAPSTQEAIDLARMVLGDDEALWRAAIEDAVGRLGLEAVCLDLLAPAARHLGDLWTEDICSFTDVTIGLMRLQSALLHITAPMEAAGARSARHTVLLAPAPGDQHTFGLTMVAGFLERAGWAVTQLTDGSATAVEGALRTGWYGVLGLSAGSECKVSALPRMLPRLRAVARNPDMGIMVGGPLFVAKPGLATEIGADATAANGQEAVTAAESLIAPHTMVKSVPKAATG